METYDSRMGEYVKADNARRARQADDLVKLALEYYAADNAPTETGVPRDTHRIHRAHDTSKTLRRLPVLSGDWADIDARVSKPHHVKVIKGDHVAHVSTDGYRRARREARKVRQAAQAANLAQEKRIALLASVGNNSDVD